jgi:subtilase family serine protease
MMLPLLLAAMLGGNVQVATTCSAADPAITQATVRSVTDNGEIKHYVVAITVTNLGQAAQAGNLLQSVDVFRDGEKRDQKGLQPLRAGQSQTVTYEFDRAAEARPGSTRLDFKLDLQAATPGSADCNASNDAFRLDA